MKLYTPLIMKAMQIAYTAHLDQVDKGGVPYIYHPAYLASQMETEEEICGALLHDVKEDCHPMYFREIEENFPENIIRIVRLLTHENGESFDQYIRKLMVDPTARKIKIKDLRHNSNKTREVLPENKTEGFEKRRGRYKKALKILKAWEIINDNFENDTPFDHLALREWLTSKEYDVRNVLIIFFQQSNSLEIYFRDGRKAIVDLKEETIDGKNED